MEKDSTRRGPGRETPAYRYAAGSKLSSIEEKENTESPHRSPGDTNRSSLSAKENLL